MSISIISYKGKSIHFFDHSQCKNEELLLKDLEESVAYISKLTSPVLVLEDYTNVFVSREYMSRAKESGNLLKSKRLKGALIGISGLKKILLSAYVKFTGENLRAFDTKEEALEYLIQ